MPVPFKRLSVFLLLTGFLLSLGWSQTSASRAITSETAGPLITARTDLNTLQATTAVTNTIKTVDFAPGGDLNGNGIVDEGDILRYTVSATNNSGSDITNLILTDTLDANTTISGTVRISTIAADDLITVTNGGTTNDSVTANDVGEAPLQVISFGDTPATVGTFPADGVTVGSFPAPGGGTLDVTIAANGNLSLTANGTTGTGTVFIYYELQAGGYPPDIARVELIFGDFPTAVDDTLATLGAGNEYSVDVGVTLNIPVGTGLLNNDTLGNPAAPLTNWGGGDASANVDRNPGTSRPFAGGTLTVNADGSFDLVNPTIPGLYTFDYIIDNNIGSSQATAEIYVNDPPVAEDDTVSANLAQVNNYPAPFLFNDNGNGADYLGAPPASLVSFGGGSLGGAVTDNAAGATVAIPVLGGTLSVNADGSFVVDTPTVTGSFTYEYQIDNGVGTSTATVTVTILATPVTQDDFLSVVLPNNLSGDLTADNGSGADDPGTPVFTSLTFGNGDLGGAVTDNVGGSSVALAGGTLTVNNDGSITLNGTTNPGSYTFDYQLTNANGTSNISTVTIEVQDPPVAQPDAITAVVGQVNNIAAPGLFADNGAGADYLGVPAATLVSFGGVDLGGAGGADNAAGATVAIPVFGGTITVNADGSVTISNPTSSGTFTFDYVIDNGAASSIATVTVTIQEAPLAQPDAYTFLFSVDQNIPAGSGLFVDNGSGADVLGFPAATLVSFGSGSLGGAVTDNAAGASVGLAGGTLTVNADGSWTLNGQPFTPGTYTFDYRIQNTAGFSDATVTLIIQDPPVAQPDALTAVVNIVNNYGAGTLFADNGSGADSLGTPAATLVSFGGGSLGGAVTDNAAGATVAFAGGTLTVNADGSLVINNPSTGGTIAFNYRIQNASGFSDATVTVTIQSPPDGFDDTNGTVTGGTSTPGSTPFHIALNGSSLAVVNAYVDNGFGADILGVPIAPTSAPADVINNVILAGSPSGATGTIGGGAIDIGGGGTIEIMTAGNINFVAPTGFVGLIEFDYMLANSIGTDATPATVTFAVGNRPVCANDAYNATGNISINTTNVAGNDVLQNDSGDQIVLTAVQGSGANIGVDTATTQGGTVNLAASGEYAYDPPTGFTGNDTFTYAIDNGFNQPATCSVTIAVSNLIYFMDSTAAAGGDGSLSNPFQTIAEHNGAPPVANSILFIEDNGTAYTGNLSLVSGQRVIGEGTTGTLFGGGSLTGVTLAPLSDAVPYNTTGLFSDWAQITNAGGAGVTSNSNNSLSGIDIGNTSGLGLTENGNVGTLTISEMQIVGTGGIISLNSGGTLNATFTSLTTTSTTGDGIHLDGINGTMNVNTTTITGVTAEGVQIANGSVAANLGTTTISSAGDAINLNATTGNFTMVISNPGLVSSNGDAIQSTSHIAQINITGGTAGLSAINGACANIFGNTGTTTLNIDVQSCNASNSPSYGIRLEDITGTGFTIRNATAIDMNGGNEPIRIADALNIPIDISDGSTVSVTDRNSTGFFIDNKDGSTLNIGTYIESNNLSFVGGYGIRVQNSTSPVDFDQANVSNAIEGTAQTFDPGSNGAEFPLNEGDGDNIFILNNPAPFSFTSNGGLIDNAGGDNIDMRSSNSLTLNNVTVEDATRTQIALTNSSGTHTLNNSTIRRYGVDTGGTYPFSGVGFLLRNTNVNATINIQDGLFQSDDANIATNTSAGVFVRGWGTSVVNVNIDATTAPILATNTAGSLIFEHHFSAAIQINAMTGATANVVINDSTFRDSNATGHGGLNLSAGGTGTGTLSGNVSNSLFLNLGQNPGLSGIINATASTNGTMRATFDNIRLDDFQRRGLQILGENAAEARFLVQNSTFVNQTITTSYMVYIARLFDTPSMHVVVNNNSIDNGSGAGLGLLSADGTTGTLFASVTNNNIGQGTRLQRDGIYLLSEDTGTDLEATLTNNNVRAAQSAGDDLFWEVGVGNPNACGNISGNSFSGDGELVLDNFGGGVFSSPQTSTANMSTVNGGATVLDFGSVTYNQPACTSPSGPYVSAPTAVLVANYEADTATQPKAQLGKFTAPHDILGGDIVMAYVPVLPDGKTVTFNYDVVVGPLAGVPEISNQAQLGADGMAPVLTDDPNQPGMSDPTVIGNLEISKTAVLTNQPGANILIDYVVTVANPSSVPLSGVVVSDTLPAGSAVLLNSATVGSYDPGSGVWAVGTVPANGSASLALQIELFLGGGQTVVNTAELISVNGLELDSGNNVAVAEVTRGHLIFLPFVANQPVYAPDLVVDSITATNDNITVVIRNVGNRPVTDAFWVDLYVNPVPIPTMPNQLWNFGTNSAGGAVWGLEQANGSLPLVPGDSLSLTIGGPYYAAAASDLTAVSGGESVYVQVDSYGDGPQLIGNVAETHELAGQAYNNISGPILLPPAFNPADVNQAGQNRD